MVHIIGERPKRSVERLLRNRQRWAKKIQNQNGIKIESYMIEGLTFSPDDQKVILEAGWKKHFTQLEEVGELPQLCAFCLVVNFGGKLLFVTECQGSVEETEQEERYNFSHLAHGTLNTITEKLSPSTIKLVQINSLGMYDYPKLYDPLEKADPVTLVAYVGDMQGDLDGKIMPWFNIQNSVLVENALSLKKAWKKYDPQDAKTGIFSM